MVTGPLAGEQFAAETIRRMNNSPPGQFAVEITRRWIHVYVLIVFWKFILIDFLSSSKLKIISSAFIEKEINYLMYHIFVD